MAYINDHSNKNVKKYAGKSYWGNDAIYAFNSDKTFMNVVLENEMTLVYKRSTPPEGVTTCSLIKKKQPSGTSTEVENATLIYPVQPTYLGENQVPQANPSLPDSLSKPNPLSKKYRPVAEEETCPLCKGTGKCSTCSGKGWYKNPLTGEILVCPNCLNHDGKCTKCHGTKKITKYKMVYE